MNAKKKSLRLSIYKWIIPIYTLLFFISNITLKTDKFDVINILIAVIAITLMLLGLKDIQRRGMAASNVFLAVFNLGIALNCLSLSYLQSAKTIDDLYFFFVGPLAFYFGLALIERQKFKNKHKTIPILSPELLGTILFVAYLAVRILVFRQTGIKLLAGNYLSQDNEEYSVGGLTGLSMMLSSMVLMSIPYVKIWKKILFAATVVTIECFLMVSRGQIIKIGAYIVILMIVQGTKLFPKTRERAKRFFRKKGFNYKKWIILLGIIIIVVFTVFGEVRQKNRMTSVFSIVNLTRFRIDSVPLAWLYGYFPINYDVLKLYYINGISPTYHMTTLLNPFIRLFGAEVTTYRSNILQLSKINISGFNASTFLSSFIIDYGYFYFIELFLAGLIVGILIKISKDYRVIGAYCFLLALVSLTTFGSYVFNAYYVYAVIAMLIISIFLKKEKVK